jgi:hypothetical protein
MVGLCGELAPRSLLLCRERFLRILFDRSDVNIASGKTQRVTITLARTAQMAAALTRQSIDIKIYLDS